MIRKMNIGGQERPIDFNFNCMEEFEEMTGVDPLNGLKVTTKNVKALMFCGLKYGRFPEGCENKDLDFTLKTVGAWLSPHDLIKVLEAYNSQDHPPEEEKKTEPQLTPEK